MSKNDRWLKELKGCFWSLLKMSPSGKSSQGRAHKSPNIMRPSGKGSQKPRLQVSIGSPVVMLPLFT